MQTTNSIKQYMHVNVILTFNMRDNEGENQEFGWCPPRCKCTANRSARILQEAMTVDGRRWGLPVTFLGEARIGQDWAHV